MSDKFQNKFIALLGSKIQNTILQQVKDGQYYSVVFDCTPDIDRKEQITMVLRHVHIADHDVSICEHFADFLNVKSSTASFLVEVMLQRLEQLGLDVMNCKGHGYVSGADIAGQHNGVQSCSLEINRRLDLYRAAVTL